MHLFAKKALIIGLLGLGLACPGHAQNATAAINASPVAMVANGHDTVTIRVTITNSNGNAVPDGTLVLFSCDTARFREDSVTTKAGTALATLVAGSVTGPATVTAKVVGLPVAPVTTTVDLVASREELSASKNYVEIVSQKPLQFSPSERKIQASDSTHQVSLRFKDLRIEADQIDLNLETYELRAIKAKVSENKGSHIYSKLFLRLDSRTGYGITTVREPELTGIKSVGRVIAFETKDSEHYGLAAIRGSQLTAAHGMRVDGLFEIAEFEDQPALITARKAVIYRNKEVQFQQAELYAGESRVMKLPLYRAPLTGERRLFTEQILNVNDNQLALNYPYYLSLKPGETSFLRLHMGDNSGLFGTSNRPQLDYQIDWERGAENYGGFLLSGIGQTAWGLELHQYYRFTNQTTGYAQIVSPGVRSVNGSMNLSHSLDGGYSASLSSSITQSLVGTPLTDQSATLLLQRDPMKVGNLPLRFSYGLTASHISTTAPISIQRQDSYGLQAMLTMLDRKLDNSTHLDGGLTVSHLMGTGVDGGLGLSANMFLRKRIDDVSFGFGYNFTEDAFQSERVGHHQVSALTSYDKGNMTLDLRGATSLDINNVQYSSSLRYRLRRPWSIAYTSSFYQYLGSSFLDYNFGLYYNFMGSKNIGLIWSYRTNRLGFQLFGD
jgi:hypothetical protein